MDPWAVEDPFHTKDWEDDLMSDRGGSDMDTKDSPSRGNNSPQGFNKDEAFIGFPALTNPQSWSQYNAKNTTASSLQGTSEQKTHQLCDDAESKARLKISEALRENIFQASCGCSSLNLTGLWAQNPLMPNVELPQQKGNLFYDPRRHRNVKTVNRSRANKQKIAEQNLLALRRGRTPWIRREFRATKSAVRHRPVIRQPELREDATVDIGEEDVCQRQMEQFAFRKSVPEQLACISSLPFLPTTVSVSRQEESLKHTVTVSVQPAVEIVATVSKRKSDEITDKVLIVQESVEEFDLSEQLHSLTIDKGRTCKIPKEGGDNPYHGRITTSCFCAVPAESIHDTRLFSSDDLEHAGTEARICAASHRNKDGQLVICRRKKGLTLHWLPRLGKLGFFCVRHVILLKNHQVCPLCNEFYEKGDVFGWCTTSRSSKLHGNTAIRRNFCHPKDQNMNDNSFVMCRTLDRSKTHLYHLTCRKITNLHRQCPHCLDDRSLCIEERFTGRGSKEIFQVEKYIDFNRVFTGIKFHSMIIPTKESAGGVHVFYCYLSEEEKIGVAAAITGYDPSVLVSSCDFTADLKALELRALVRACRLQFDLTNFKDAEGNSLLHDAAKTAKAAAVVLLCACGLNVNDKNAAQETPLMVAVKYQSLAAVFALEKLGADTSAQDEAGQTALHYASFSRNCRLMLYLMEMGAQPFIKDKAGFEPIFSVLPWIQEMDFYSLICAGSGLHWIDSDGWSLLHWIACLQRNDLVKYFFDTELAYLRDKWGDTPMHVAVRVGNPGFFEQFLTAKVPIVVMRENNQGETEYDLAIQRDQIRIKQLMEQYASKHLKVYAADERIKPFNDVPVGQIYGDFSRGKGIYPVPCYDFVNSTSTLADLLYSNVVLRPFVYQKIPKPLTKMTEPCTTKNISCVKGRCRCMEKRKCKPRQYCSEACKDADGGHFDSNYVDGCYVEDNEDTGRIILDPDSRKPNLTAEHLKNLEYRLLRKSEMSNGLTDDLFYVMSLLDSGNENGNEKRRRCRSRVRHIRRVRRMSSTGNVPTGNGFKGKQKAYKWVGDECILVGSEQWEAILREKAVTVEPGYIPKNTMDLFYELQEFDVRDPFIAAAPLWFEKRHLGIRWDLSSKYSIAPRIHPRSADPYPQHRYVGAGSDLLKKWTIPPDPGSACSVLCECSIACPNRTVRSPTTARMALIYRNQQIGWGVLALARIMRGQFITEYTGELVKGSLYGNDTYLFDLVDLDAKTGDEVNEEDENWVVDAKRVGNIGRFFNHSCNPNVRATEVWEHGMKYPLVCAFALRTILPQDELTLNYGDAWWKVKQDTEKLTCNCGEPTCRYNTLKKLP